MNGTGLCIYFHDVKMREQDNFSFVGLLLSFEDSFGETLEIKFNIVIVNCCAGKEISS